MKAPCYNESMTPQVLIENLLAILKDFPDIDLVYLFGSRVSGKTGPMSDYDLAIFGAARGNAFATQIQFQHALAMLLKTERVDVVLLNTAPIELAYQIIATGKVLYQKDAYTRVEYEAEILGKYGDYLPILRSYKSETLNGDAHAKRIQRYREALRRTQRTLGTARTSPQSRTR